MINGTNRGTRAGVINSCQCVYSTANIASVIGTSPYRNEQVLIVFPDYNLRKSPNLEEVSVPKLQIQASSLSLKKQSKRPQAEISPHSAVHLVNRSKRVSRA